MRKEFDVTSRSFFFVFVPLTSNLSPLTFNLSPITYKLKTSNFPPQTLAYITKKLYLCTLNHKL